jgi:ribose transport system permease protein
VGVTLVIIAGGIDLSVGGAIALASVIVAGLLRAGWPVSVAIVVTLCVGALVGAIAALLVTRAELPPFIATLALLLITRGVAFAFTRGDNWSITTAPGFTDSFGNGSLLGMPYPALVLVLADTWRCVVPHPFGMGTAGVCRWRKRRRSALRWCGCTSRYVQRIHPFRIGCGTGRHRVCGALRSGAFDSRDRLRLDVVAAAVVGGASLSGGRGSIVGAVLGALIFATLRKGLSQVPGGATYNQVIVGVVVIAAVLLDQLTRRRVAR